jgi:hypothetical protein
MDILLDMFYADPMIVGFSNADVNSTIFTVHYADGTCSTVDDAETALDVYLLAGGSSLQVAFTR